MTADPPIRLVYLAGAGHSGSTLLELLLGAHSRVSGLGELKVLTSRRADRRAAVLAQPCTCGAGDKTACAFWSRVDAGLRDDLGHGLDALELDARDPRTFARENLALLRAARDAARSADGAPPAWLVDSSKSPRRLARLLATRSVEVFPVWLSRDPRGVVHSNVAKGRGFGRAATRHLARLASLRRVLRGRPHHALRYEDLVARPEAELEALLTVLGLSPEKPALDWTRTPQHLLNGNRMRFSRTPVIAPDERWRAGLSPAQRAVGGVLARLTR